VLTDTLMQGLKNDIARQEAELKKAVVAHGTDVPTDTVGDATLHNLWGNTAWSNASADGSGDWLADDVRIPANRAAVDHYGLGAIYRKLGDTGGAVTEFTRALALRPNFSEVLTALQEVQSPTPTPTPEPSTPITP
jgi:hypothetical protein